MEFLNDLTARPLNISEARGTIPAGLFLGRGSSAIEVAVLRSPVRPTTANLRAIWSSRLAGRATPLLVVVLHGQLAALCGPNGDTPPAFPDLDRERVERICRTALSEPDRNAALRFLAAVIPSIDEQLPGLRNEGLFATHELHRGLPQNAKRWTRAREQAERLLPLRAEQLIQSLGYSLELTPGPVCILRAGDQRRAVAVLLDRNESPDLPNERFAQLSPVSYALARADQENLDWVIVAAGASLRLHPVGTGVGTGRRGRAETFTEIHLDLLLPADSAYLWLLFSAESLRKDGIIEELLRDSARYAADLGTRLRERVYNDVVPGLAMAVLNARGLRNPTATDLDETYQMTLVYLFRILFVAYAEDKELLPYRHNSLYRDRSLKHKAIELTQLKNANSGFGPDSSHWQEIDQLFRAVDAGNSSWGVPAYNGGLFSRDVRVSPLGALLAEITIPDSVLGPILTSLLVEGSPEGWGPVDFRSLGVREFGTIYEGLLENELAIAEGDLTVRTRDRVQQYSPAGPKDRVVVPRGNAYLFNASGARKSTGSYFTKHFAVEHLLDHALEPALNEHCARLTGMSEDEAGDAFFDFRVADLAMGSGHFLVAAVDRIERRLANYLAERPLPRVREELLRLRDSATKALGPIAASITIEDTQLIRRQIARRCVYGVDLNPIAVDLARLAIWIHTFVPGLPLSFLDHNLVPGNALVGIGTLDEANDWLQEIGGSLMRVRTEELEPALFPLKRLATLSDANAAEIAEARQSVDDARAAAEPVAALFDILAAARIDEETRAAVWQNAVRWSQNLAELPDDVARRRARTILDAIPPFHFPVAFPEVFLRERSGFDVLLGNPPWEESVVEEDRFWNRHFPGFHSLKQREQENQKAMLRRDRPDLLQSYREERAEADLTRKILTSGQYSGMGTGDPDLYKAFYWRFWELLAHGSGWAGIVLPRSAMAAKGSSEFRRRAFEDGRFADLTWVLNSGGWVFDDVEHRYTIVLAAFTKQSPVTDQTLPLRGPYRSLERFEEGTAKVPLQFSLNDVGTWTDTWALPLLPSENAGEVFAQLRKAPRLDARNGDWRARPQREFDATNDKALMRFAAECPDGCWPIFKGESFDIWENDKGSYYAWGDPNTLLPALQQKRLRSGRLARSAFSEFSEGWLRDLNTLPCLRPRIVFRDITRATDTRTVRAALVPQNVFLTNKAPYLVWPAGDERDEAFLLGVLCSRSLDWYARRFVEINLNFFILNPFPVPRPPKESALWQRTVTLAARLAASDDRFTDWAAAVGVECGPLTAEEKDASANELDAVVAHLYGLSASQLRTVYETFHEGWDFEVTLREVLKYFEDWKQRL